MAEIKTNKYFGTFSAVVVQSFHRDKHEIFSAKKYDTSSSHSASTINDTHVNELDVNVTSNVIKQAFFSNIKIIEIINNRSSFLLHYLLQNISNLV